MQHNAKLREWMLPVILILFILQIILFPIMIGLTYATRSERPEHTLTYNTSRSLVWDKDTSVRADGSAALNFFETVYQNVNSENAMEVLAPGTKKDSVVRLKNDTKRTVYYTAVLYNISSSSLLDISASLSGEGFYQTDSYSLPASVDKNSVVGAVEGSLSADAIQDFDINWFWNFEDGTDARNIIDTYLGNKSAEGDADEQSIGFYLVVHDGGDIAPSPKTGDNTAVFGYVILLFISVAMAAAFTLIQKRSDRNAD